jgi:hypothetical protein
MKYNLIKTIEKIIDFEANHNFAIKEGKVYNFVSDKTIEEIEKQRNIYSFGDNYVISKDLRGNSFIIHITDLKIDITDKISSFSYPYLSLYKDTEGIRKYTIYDYLLKKILFETTGWIGRDIIGDYIFSDYQGVITCRNIFSEQPLWQFDLLQLGSFIGSDGVKNNYKVDKFIAIHKHILFIALNLPSHSIIALDIQTGKLLQKWEQIPYNIGANYDPYSKTIFGFGYQNYWQIDIDTLSLETYNLAETFLQKGLETTRNNVNIPVNQKHYLISIDTPVDEKENRYYNGIALFNKQTKKLDWHYVFDKNVFLGSNDPKMSDNKLYQLDTDGNLHIFENQTDEQV